VGGTHAGEVEISHGDAADDVAERLSFCKEADPPPPPRLIDEKMKVKRCVVCMDRWHYVGIVAWWIWVMGRTLFYMVCIMTTRVQSSGE